MVYGECGKVPLAIKIKVRMISYWTRLISMQERSLNHIMYNILFKLDRHNTYSAKWITAIKNILNECGLSYIWRTQTFTSELWLKNFIESILKDQFYQKWASDISNSNKCINY